MKGLLKILAPAVLCLIVAIPLVSAQGTPIGEVDTSAGEAIYNSVCLACHQMTGEGTPYAFPPLANHFPDLVAVEGGREYVIDVVLFGLMGAIDVEGITYNSVMTPHVGMFDDQQVADVLNYVSTAWENAALLPEGFEAFTADEVAGQRGALLSSAEVYEKRQALGLE